jgi:hypothetical protein
MQPLLDHEDFVKSRKALLVASLFLLLTQHVNWIGAGGAIAIMSLQIDHNAITGLACLTAIYFCWVFLFHSAERAASLVDDVEDKFSSKLATLEANHNKASEAFDQAMREYSASTAGTQNSNLQQAITDQRRKWQRYSKLLTKVKHRVRFKVIMFAVVEFLPPFLFFIWAVSRLNVMAAVKFFLLPL